MIIFHASGFKKRVRRLPFKIKSLLQNDCVCLQKHRTTRSLTITRSKEFGVVIGALT